MVKDNQDNTFAVIEVSGRQYQVAVGDIVKVDKLEQEIKPGESVTLDKVLLVDTGKDTKIGTPYVQGAKVTAELVEEGKDRKILVMRFRAKSNYHRRYGHRQPFTKLKITAIA